MTRPLAAVRADLARIRPLREMFLADAAFQVRYHAYHERGWTDSYVLTLGDADIGYGSVKGREIADRDTVFEFFVLPAFEHSATRLFGDLLAACGATHIEAQTNDALMAAMLFEFGRQIRADVMLFTACLRTHHVVPGAVFRTRRDGDAVFAHTTEPVGNFVVERDGEIAGTGGFLLHYNEPFADVFMEVAEPHRRQGIGSFIVQEIVKQCYLHGRIPSARCHIGNVASRATLAKAGMRRCGFLLVADAVRTAA